MSLADQPLNVQNPLKLYCKEVVCKLLLTKINGKLLLNVPLGILSLVPNLCWVLSTIKHNIELFASLPPSFGNKEQFTYDFKKNSSY